MCRRAVTLPLGTHHHMYDKKECTGYRGDGIDGVQDSEQQHVVDAPGIVRVSRPRDLLTGGVVDEGRVACNINLVFSCVSDSIAGAVHILILHQRLPLLGHHDNIAERR